jgi:ABC-2 type transport system ATP-binding protein
MIEIKNLYKNYGNIQALKDVTFTVDKGEIVGFLGPNGAGKSTAMNIMTGYISYDNGSVKICDFDILEEPNEVKKRIGYLPENPPLYPELSVYEYLRFVSELKHVPKKEIKESIDKILEITQITDHKKRIIKNLSKGYKQRVGLAQALVGNPEVLILDEPTVGLDPNQIIEIRNVIKRLGKEHTIILSSHILPEVSAVCEKIVIINNGEIVAIDSAAALSKQTDSDNVKFIFTISGPKNSVLKTIQNVQGVKRVSAGLEVDVDEVEYEVQPEKNVDVRKVLFFELAKAGFPILETRSEGMSLEDVFIKYTKTEDDTKKEDHIQ